MAHRIMLAVVAALVLPAAAHAQVAPSQRGRAALASFNQLDRDGDGGLTLAELRARGKEKAADLLFALLDADGDGRISVKELGAVNGALLARFDAYDVNKDGFVTRREFPNYVDPLLVAALDRNRDGRLSLAELRPAFAGSRTAAAQPVAAHKPARTKPADHTGQPTCWITGFGRHHQWTFEAPVTSQPCRTQ